MPKEKPEFTISQIKIMMNLSDPDKSDKPIAFTSSILYNPLLKSVNKLSEYPYFTQNIKYPKRVLQRKSYSERVQFFFNKAMFKLIINNYSNQNKSDADPDNYKVKATNTNVTFFETNVNTMIELLFPTVFPVVGNYINSFKTYILNSGNPEFNFTFKDAFPRMFTQLMPNLSTFFSYLKVDNKIYTITKITWLNDFINHPLYRNLLDSYSEFNTWRKEKTPLIDEDIVSLTQKVIKDLETQIKNKKVEITKSIQNICELITIEKETSRYAIRNQYIISLVELLLKLYNIDPKTVEQINDKDKKKNNDDSNEEYNKLKDFKKNIKSFNYTFKPTEEQKTEEQNILSILESIRDKFTKPPQDIQIPRELINLLNPLITLSSRIKSLSYIQDKYFKNTDTTNINFDEDPDEVKKEFTETNYKQYFEFIKSIKLLVTPNTESSNKALQKIIYDYTKSSDPQFSKYLENIKTKYLSGKEINLQIDNNIFKKTNDTFPLYVGVSSTAQASSNLPKYEIYLNVDVIGGELTNETIPQIKCNYTGEALGVKFEKYIQQRLLGETAQYEVDKKRFFFDIKIDGPEYKKKNEENELNNFQNKQKQISIADKTENKKKVGGRKTLKKIKNRKFTRKYRY